MKEETDPRHVGTHTKTMRSIPSEPASTFQPQRKAGFFILTSEKMCYNKSMKKTGIIETSSPTPVESKKQTGAEIEKKQKAKGGRNYVPKGIGRGGEREKAGRETKPEKVKVLGVSATIEQHLIEEVDVVEINVDTKARVVTKKPAVRAILDMLRYEALKHRNVKAAKEYFDRTLGRARQHIDMTAEIVTDEEQSLPTKAEKAAARAYLSALEDDEE